MNAPAFTSFAVIPAAGRSTRMGTPKLLLPWGEGTMLDAVLRAWRGSTVAEVVITICREDPELAAIARRHDVRVVETADRPADMKASVLLALEWIQQHLSPTPRDAWLMAPADLPTLDSAVIDALLRQYNASSSDLLIPVHDGRRGHPVLFPWDRWRHVAALGSDEGIDKLARSLPVREIPCGSACLAPDVDTPEVYQRLHCG